MSSTFVGYDFFEAIYGPRKKKSKKRKQNDDGDFGLWNFAEVPPYEDDIL